jgi:hypothetical protein
VMIGEEPAATPQQDPWGDLPKPEAAGGGWE